MIQAFIIVLREGFEAFLIVAIIFAYLRKTGKATLLPAVKWGVVASVVLSVVAGYFMMLGENEPLWEGVFGIVASILIIWLIVHMWRTAPTFKKDMENRLAETTVKPGRAAWIGVFFFTSVMIVREGMETALLLMQVHDPNIWTGAALGAFAAGLMALLWVRVGHLINLKLFFQVTAIFLFIFVTQVMVYSFHELAEAGIFPNSQYWHDMTEPFAPDGRYGQWISFGMIFVCALWLAGAWLKERFKKPGTAL